MRPQPKGDDWCDNLDLTHDRLFRLYQVNPAHVDDPPKLVLEECDDSEALEDFQPGRSIWFYPEDLPRIIDWLRGFLGALRESAASDQKRLPAPYWGDLGDGS